ncbi:MAG TPA: hypothetical protein VJ810_25135 [Blastocatellia bacterium]|nr:hypothetical protein [Blastocatellia bacterium]
MFTSDSSNRGTLLNNCSPGVRNRDSVGDRHCEIRIAGGSGRTNGPRRRMMLGGFLTGTGEGETGGGVELGAGLSDRTLSIGACRLVDCLKDIHHPRHPAPSKINAATPATNRHMAQLRRGFSRRDRAPFQS